MSTDTLCRSGPITSVFTAAALVNVARAGKNKTGAAGRQVCQWAERELSAVNAYQLLSHTAGLKEEHPSSGLFDDQALGRTVRSWKDDYSISRPGQIYSHSNPGHALAGLLIEEVSQKPLQKS